MHADTDDPLRLPSEPPPPNRPAVPLAAAIVPVVGAVVLWQLTGSAYALWFAALGPLMALAAFADALRTQRVARRKARRRTRATLVALERDLVARQSADRDERWRRTPDVAGYAARPDEIWRAVPGRDTVMVVGRGADAGRVRIEGEAHDEAARELRRRARVAIDVPITVPVSAGVAVVGPAVPAAAVVRALVLQVCLARAPGAVRLVGEGVAAAGVGGLPHAAATAGDALFVGIHGRPLPPDVDIPIVQVAPGAPPPPRCAAVLTLETAERARLDHDGTARDVRVEAVSRDQARIVCSELELRAAALGQRFDGTVRLSELPVACDADGESSLRATVGTSAGDPVLLDVVDDGPHAVVVGVTGAGKSELLTTWIAGMCRGRSPQQVSFLLVDFKGGRTFDALAGLPHVTGVLTDLDETQAVRAIESLRAEIRHRERVLAAADARDIDEAGGRLARLVIVVDEFAALVAARPELHDLFADVAARGRALGMHLILASQRAAGAFRDGVLANAPLRIAFRVTDAADSRAVVGTDDAARLPGSASARGMALVRRSADVAPWPARIARCEPGDLDRLRADGDGALPARRPWLPPLAARIGVEDARRLLTVDGLGGGDLGDAIVVGVADEPERQRQTAVVLDRAAGGLLVLGGPGSGRTTLLRTIAAQAQRPLWVPAEPEGAWDAVAALGDAPRGAVVLIDDADVLHARLTGDHGLAWAAELERLAREARGRGVALVVSVGRLTGTLGRTLDLLPRRVLLPMASRADHVAAGGEVRSFDPDAPAGRGRFGRTLVQVALAPASGATEPPRGADPPGVQFARETPTAVVAPAGPRSDAYVTAAMRAGCRATSIAETDAAGARAGDVVVGAPDEWLGQWRALGEARARWPVVVDAGCAAEFRAITGIRDLPPFIAPGAGRAWQIAPGGVARRVLLA